MNVGLFLIHVVPGLLIAAHGSQKLFGLFGGAGPAVTAKVMESHGLRPGKRMAMAAGVNELAGGLLLALGLLVPVAAVLISASFLVAARTAHRGRGPWINDGGWEYVLVLSTVAIGLAFNGAGTWSLDNAIGWDVAGLWWGIGAAAVAVAGGVTVLAGRRRPAKSRRPHRTAHTAAGAS